MRPYRIDEIRLEGVARFDAPTLAEFSHLGESSAWPWGDDVLYDEGLARIDRERIEALYRAFGYYRARVEAVRIEPLGDEDDTPRSARVVVEVDEGPPTRVTAIAIEWPDGRPPTLATSVERRPPIRVGDAFSVEAFERAASELRLRVRVDGYALAKVEHQARVDRDAGTAEIAFAVRPGPVCYFDDVQIEGLEAVPEDLVRREVDFVAGRRWSPGLVDRAERAVYALDVFEAVTAAPPEQPDPEGRLPLVLRVRERSPRSLKLGVGLGFEPTRWEERATALYTHRNFDGRLLRLDARVQAGYAELPALWDPQRHGAVFEIEPRFTKRGLLEPKLVWTLAPGYEIGIDDGYRFQAARLRTGVSRFFAGFMRTSLGHTFEYFDFFDLNDAFSANRTALGPDFRPLYQLSYVTLEHFAYLTDALLEPQNGLVIGASVDYAGGPVRGDFDFVRLRPSAKLYWTPHPRFQGALRLETGVIRTFGLNPGAPIRMRFALGSADTVRGWGLRRLSPQIRDCGADETCRGVPIGGDTMVLGNLELRARIGGPAWLAIFADAGDVQPGELEWSPPDWQFAVGAGVRFETPVGRFRLDYGRRLTDDPVRFPDEPQWAFHLALGEVF